MENYTHLDELQHHGTKGMKWGVRRYQNSDGSLTLAGKLRYGQKSDGTLSDAGKKRYNEDMAKLKAKEKIVKNREATAAKMKKLADKERELEERKTALKGGNKKKTTSNDDDGNEAVKDKTEPKNKLINKSKKISDMTNEEIQAKIDRLKLEKSLKELEAEKENPKSETGKGKKIAEEILTNSAKNVGSQTATYLMGTLMNKALENVAGDSQAINPKKGQKDK